MLIGPRRPARKQRVTYAVLVDAEAELAVQQNPLIDFDLTSATQRRSVFAPYIFVLLIARVSISAAYQLVPGVWGIILGA